MIRPAGVKEGEIETLDVAEDLHAQVEHDLLPRPVGEVCLDVGDAELEQKDPEIEQGYARKSAQIALNDVIVDRDFGQQRADQPKRGRRRQQDHGEEYDPTVGTQVAEQAPGQAVIVDLSQTLFFVKGRHPSMSSSSLSSCLRCRSA